MSTTMGPGIPVVLTGLAPTPSRSSGGSAAGLRRIFALYAEVTGHSSPLGPEVAPLPRLFGVQREIRTLRSIPTGGVEQGVAGEPEETVHSSIGTAPRRR